MRVGTNESVEPRESGTPGARLDYPFHPAVRRAAHRHLRWDHHSYGLVNTPPSGSQSVGEGSQALPFQALWNISLLVPRPKMSRRLGPQETAAGGLLNTPPTGSQSVGEGSQAPFQALWNISLLVPRPKMSRRLGPQETAAGGLLNTPPSGSQSVGEG